MSNKTPSNWRTDRDWKFGKPNRVVLSGERPGDMAQLPETAGGDTPRRRHRLLDDIALLVAVAASLALLYMLADTLVKMR